MKLFYDDVESSKMILIRKIKSLFISLNSLFKFRLIFGIKRHKKCLFAGFSRFCTDLANIQNLILELRLVQGPVS